MAACAVVSLTLMCRLFACPCNEKLVLIPFVVITHLSTGSFGPINPSHVKFASVEPQLTHIASSYNAMIQHSELNNMQYPTDSMPCN